MTVIIPARALVVEQEIKNLYEDIRRLSDKLMYCYNLSDSEFESAMMLIREKRISVNIARADMRLLLSEAKHA